jgi:hypothetical protein
MFYDMNFKFETLELGGNTFITKRTNFKLFIMDYITDDKIDLKRKIYMSWSIIILLSFILRKKRI